MRICMCVSLYVHVCMSLSVCLSVCAYINVFLYICVCLYVSLCVYVCVCVCVCVCVSQIINVNIYVLKIKVWGMDRFLSSYTGPKFNSQQHLVAHNHLL